MAADHMLPLMRRRPLHVLLCIACACICCALEVATTADAAADAAPQTLDALVADFHAGLQRAASEREMLQTRMESTRELIRDLFANEREKTQVHVVETRLKMNAMREGMRAEMDNVVREFRQQIVYAAQNVSALVKRREHVKRESEQRLQQLKRKQEDVRRQRQRTQGGDDKNAVPSSVADDQNNTTESVKNATSSTRNNTKTIGKTTVDIPTIWQRAYEACQIAQAYASQTSNRITTTVSGWLNQAGFALADWPMCISATTVSWAGMLWSTFFVVIVGIVTTVWQLCLRLLVPVAIAVGLLLSTIICVALYKAWQRAKRKQRVLYSEYLKTPRRRSKSDKAARTTRQTHVVVRQRSQRRVPVSAEDSSSSSSQFSTVT